MNSETLMKLAIGGGLLFAVYKFAPGSAVKAMALGALGVAVAKQMPYTRDIV